jgi:hypothetical protein
VLGTTLHEVLLSPVGAVIGSTSLFDLGAPSPVSFCMYNGAVYFTNGHRVGWIPADSSQPRWAGSEAVHTTPTLAVAPGALPAGRYGVVVTHIDDRGEESAATPMGMITLPTSGGIALSNLPVFGATHRIVVFITDPDGDVLRSAVDSWSVSSSMLVTDVASGGECETRHMSPLHPGTKILGHAGRLYTFRNGQFSFSEPMRPHLMRPAHNTVFMSGFLSMASAVTGGLYVGDSRGVWYFDGEDPSKYNQRLVSSVRVVRGSDITIPGSLFPDDLIGAPADVAVWLSGHGYMLGLPGGSVKAPNEGQVRVPDRASGRSAVLTDRGVTRIVTLIDDGTILSGATL